MSGNTERLANENSALLARVVELEAERDNAFAEYTRCAGTPLMSDVLAAQAEAKRHIEKLFSERDAAIQRAEEYKQSWLQVEEAFNECLAHDAVRDEQCRVAIQRGDSNYAAFEQVTKIAEDLRAHMRKMLAALPAERAEQIMTIYKHSFLDSTDATLHAYAQAARDAQANNYLYNDKT